MHHFIHAPDEAHARYLSNLIAQDLATEKAGGSGDHLVAVLINVCDVCDTTIHPDGADGCYASFVAHEDPAGYFTYERFENEYEAWSAYHRACEKYRLE